MQAEEMENEMDAHRFMCGTKSKWAKYEALVEEAKYEAAEEIQLAEVYVEHCSELKVEHPKDCRRHYKQSDDGKYYVCKVKKGVKVWGKFECKKGKECTIRHVGVRRPFSSPKRKKLPSEKRRKKKKKLPSVKKRNKFCNRCKRIARDPEYESQYASECGSSFTELCLMSDKWRRMHAWE